MARISSGTTKRPKICFDEWNIWDPVRAPGDKGAEERYTVSDMLAMACGATSSSDSLHTDMEGWQTSRRA